MPYKWFVYLNGQCVDAYDDEASANRRAAQLNQQLHNFEATVVCYGDGSDINGVTGPREPVGED